jgi:hypothetical protein
MINSSSVIKDKAIQLRSSGRSFREISKEIKIPLSTIHLWTKTIVLTSLQKQKLHQKHLLAFEQGRISAQKINHLRSTSIKNQYIDEGKKVIGALSKRELILIGVALYWSEGFKKDSRLGFANSDPDMINLFLKWLYEVGEVKKENIRLRVGINIHHESRTDEIQNKWSEITQIPLSQFQKPFYQKTKQNKVYLHPENYLGVLRIRVNKQAPFFYKILGMIEGLKSAND